MEKFEKQQSVGGMGHEPGRLLIEHLAARWKCSVSGIRKKLVKGSIPPEAYFQIGGPGSRLIFREEVIERLEKEGT